MNGKVQEMVDALPVIYQLAGGNSFMTILDESAVICGYIVPDGVPPQFQVGDTFVDSSGGYAEVMRTGRAKYNYLPKEVMGEAFEGILVPIKDGMETVGCIINSYSVEVKERMTSLTEQFRQTITEAENSIEEMVKGIETLSNALTNVTDSTSRVDRDVNDAVGIVGQISGNASRSNILALNASIEAARSGEAGRGFTVVAKEMGKLAQDSGDSAARIKDSLYAVKDELGGVVTEIGSANVIARNHLQETSSIKEMLQKTLSLAKELQGHLKE